MNRSAKMIGALRFATLAAVISSQVLGGCGRDESEAVAVARAYADASRKGDVKALLLVIDSVAVTELKRAATQASAQVGGRRSIEATEMLQIVGVDRTLAVAEATLVEQAGSTAEVELTMTDGRTAVIHLVWESGAWKVRVPPPAPAPTPVPSQPDA